MLNRLTYRDAVLGIKVSVKEDPPPPVVDDLALRHGSNSMSIDSGNIDFIFEPIPIVEKLIPDPKDDGWITVVKKHKKGHQVSLPIWEKTSLKQRTIVSETLSNPDEDIEWTNIILPSHEVSETLTKCEVFDFKDAYYRSDEVPVDLDEKVIEILEAVDDESETTSEIASINTETTVSTSAKVVDSSDSSIVSNGTIELENSIPFENLPKDSESKEPMRIHCMDLSEYSNGLFNDFDNLNIKPGNQILPERHDPLFEKRKEMLDEIKARKHYSCVVTRSTRNENSIESTSQPREPESEDEEVNTETEEAVEITPNVERNVPPPIDARTNVGNTNPPEPEVLAQANLPEPRELLVTPTNLTNDMNDGSITTEPVIEQLSEEDQLIKYVVINYMKEVMGLDLPDDMHISRLRRTYQGIPAHEVQLFSHEFLNGPGTGSLNVPANSPVPPLPVPLNIPRPVHTPNANMNNGVSQTSAFSRRNNSTTLSERRRPDVEQKEDEHSDDNHSAASSQSSRASVAMSKKEIEKKLNKKVMSFSMYFSEHSHPQAKFDIQDANWFRLREEYVKSLMPSSESLQREAQKAAHKLYKEITKTSSASKMEEIKHFVSQKKRAEHYRTWIQSLYFILIHEFWTAKIVNERGRIQVDAAVPWYALKAAALIIQSKIASGMRHHYHEIDKDDPIAILLKFEDICGGVNETTKQEIKLEYETLCIGENESASNFMIRATKVFNTAYLYGLDFSETDRVDKIIFALRGNHTYDHQRSIFQDKRRIERKYPDRPYDDNLTIHEMSTIFNNLDGEIYEGLNRKQKRQKTKSNHQSNNVAAPAEDANQANVATRKENQYKPKPCFHCKSTKHNINHCPTATQEQKAAAWAAFNEEQAKKRNASANNEAGADKTFVSNKFKNSNSPNTGSSQKQTKAVRFSKAGKGSEANYVSVIYHDHSDTNHSAYNVEEINAETNASQASTPAIKGIPPVHQSGIGNNPTNYWLIDSGTSTHMTPYLKDLDTNSFRPLNGEVRVADAGRANIIGIGNVTLLIKCYETGRSITWTLYDVLVVPGLVRRLISTDELVFKCKHSVMFEPTGTVIIIREAQTATTRRKTTVIKVPTEWEKDDISQQYHWPARDYQTVSRDPRPSILVSAVFVRDDDDETVNTDQDSCVASTEQAMAVEENVDEQVIPAKRSTHMHTIHNRLGHRSFESILLGNHDDIWNDTQVIRDPESICQTCQITLSRKSARRRKTSSDFPKEPGRMIMTDIISNPFTEGLNERSHFDYYLMIVDVYSSLPVLLGLRSLTANNVIQTLKLYLTMFKPDINQPRPDGEINANKLQHIRADAGTQFTSVEFIQACTQSGINVSLAAPKHQEMNGLCERTWQSVRNLAFSFMNYARVDGTFGDMALEHAWKVFAVLPIKGLCKKSKATTPFELFYGTKPSVRKFRVLFCPCVYKVYNRQKKTKSHTRRFDAKTHPQRGVIGIFCGFPRSQAGYLIWEPRSKQLKVSADVQFDEKFHCMGPRQHYAFDDALPVFTKRMKPDIDKFQRTDNDDDHEGTPLLDYAEEVESDGYLIMATGQSQNELFDDDQKPAAQDKNRALSHTIRSPSPDNSSMEESTSSEEDTQSMDDTSSMEEKVLVARKPRSTISKKKSTKGNPEPINEQAEDSYHDPSALVQQPTRRSVRQRKSRQIYDPSTTANSIDYTNWSNMVTAAFDANTPFDQVIPFVFNLSVNKPSELEGADPSAFLPEPKSLKRVALMEPTVKDAWLKAFRSELMNLITKNTFALPNKYKGEKCLPVCAIFKTKIKADGNIDKLKVRIAIRGDLDRDALDEDNSAPLATFRLLKVFLSEAARLKRRVYQADFIGAYLQAHMDRLVYVRLPSEYAEHFPDLKQWFGVPLILKKSAYGINSAGRLWAEELFGWYTEFGFKQSEVEPSLFKYKNGNDWIILLSYCDDTAYFTSSEEVRKKFEKAMCQRFDCKLLGQLHWFLQARITQDQKYNITIDQSRYAASMCKRFLPNEEIISPSEADKLKYLAPLPASMVFTKADRSKDAFTVKQLEDEFQLKYPVVIGSLLWILNSYPRLQFAIRKLAKFMNLPGKVHFRALRHLLQHVRCHHLCGLTFYSDVMDAPISKLLFDNGIDPSETSFFGFADSSWQDCPDTSRSTGGYHIILQGGIVDSATTFPTPVARSSAEAEYNNASCAAAAVNAMAMLVQDIRFGDPDEPLRIPLLLDNKACIAMGESFKDTKRTRHILRGYHYVRWMIKEGRLVLVWISSEIQLADPATKNLIGSAGTLVKFREHFETIVLL